MLSIQTSVFFSFNYILDKLAHYLIREYLGLKSLQLTIAAWIEWLVNFARQKRQYY